jgi:hypothetical protein
MVQVSKQGSHRCRLSSLGQNPHVPGRVARVCSTRTFTQHTLLSICPGTCLCRGLGSSAGPSTFKHDIRLRTAALLSNLATRWFDADQLAASVDVGVLPGRLAARCVASADSGTRSAAIRSLQPKTISISKQPCRLGVLQAGCMGLSGSQGHGTAAWHTPPAAAAIVESLALCTDPSCAESNCTLTDVSERHHGLGAQEAYSDDDCSATRCCDISSCKSWPCVKTIHRHRRVSGAGVAAWWLTGRKRLK